jgi:excisionase family DNA binding protein
MTHPTLLTLDEAAARLTIAKKTLRDWLKADPPKLRGVKIGREWRIVERELEAFLARALGPQPPDTTTPEPDIEDLQPDPGPLRLVSKGTVPTEPEAPAAPPVPPRKPLDGLRAQIVEVLRPHPAGLTPAQVKAALGTEKDPRDTMRGMLRDRILRRTDEKSYGRYVVAERW